MNRLGVDCLNFLQHFYNLSNNRFYAGCKNQSLMLVILLPIISGCSSVATSSINVEPFTEFNQAAKQFVQVENAVSHQISSVKESWLSRMALDSNKIRELGLEFYADDTYRYDYKFESETEPLFLKWEKFGNALSELNQTFIDYTLLLKQLADGELNNEEDFNILATDLNENASSALQALGKSPEKNKMALFSSAASIAAQKYINQKRKLYLIEMIESNQALVESYVQTGREAVGIIADDTKAEYQNYVRSLLNQWLVTRSNRNKRAIASRLYSKSELTAKTLDMLKAINQSYDLLAKSHKSLALGLEDKGFSVSKLVSSIKKAQRLYKKLNQVDEKVGLTADQSDSG